MEFIGVYSMPAFLPLGIGILVLAKRDWSLGPRLLIGGSLLLVVATWIGYLAYWAYSVCGGDAGFDTCDGSASTQVFDDLFIAGAAGLVCGVAWLAARLRASRRQNAVP